MLSDQVGKKVLPAEVESLTKLGLKDPEMLTELLDSRSEIDQRLFKEVGSGDTDSADPLKVGAFITEKVGNGLDLKAAQKMALETFGAEAFTEYRSSAQK